MPISQLLRDFDEGVERARFEYAHIPFRSRATAFSDIFASFVLYDVTAADHAQEERSKFVRVYPGGNDTQPILWKHIHKPLARILREDPDIGPLYAGFATLFTVYRNDVVGGRPFHRYYSMAIDAPLSSNGFRQAELSRAQFVGDYAPGKPLPLTAVCLNSGRDDLPFRSIPVIFHWASSQGPDVGEHQSAYVDQLKSWAHVFITANIPHAGHPNHKDGLRTDVTKCGFVHPISVADPSEVFCEDELYSRLSRFVEAPNANRHELGNQLAWTPTYFAYACSELGKAIQTHPPVPIRRLAIVCAPASYDSVVSAALYLPLFYTGPSSSDSLACEDSKFCRAALKTLYLARSLGMPLERIRDVDTALLRGEKETIDVFAHQIRETAAAVRHGWLVSKKNWDEALETFGRPGNADSLPEVPDYKIAPVPDLYASVCTTLSIWAQSRRWQDVFPTLTEPPETLRKLVETAFGYSRDIHLVSLARNLNFNDDPVGELMRLRSSLSQSDIRVATHLRFSEGETLVRLADTSTDASWELHLCDLLRLLLALFDNYMGRGNTKKPIDVHCSIFDPSETYELSFSNANRQVEQETTSGVWPGMNGLQVISILVRRLCGVIVPQNPTGDRSRYSTRIRLPIKPLWKVMA